ncbi:dihydrofolate reductase [Clostridium sp. D2Q-11]|uniref:Dihydrofolate reductase n=1 Tax=Anaeromonas frigoriresistens TaxID=2683708 RepID=A0A942UZ42_9FIRM|nr:dihydrofolate reductase family protein [Anaeromonas frigoriresistens]MBS4539464.1 dihydrofolate reductase [Anaeromonas frigoriresistens]
MRKIILQSMITVDGRFAGPKGDISWHNVDEEYNHYALNFLSSLDTLLFGRVTYELMQSYWPTTYAIENDPRIAKYMNSLSKIVFSKTLDKVTWNNTKLFSDILVEEITELKQLSGKDMAILGSSKLANAFIKYDLIDEFRIIVNPLVLGQGISLFQGLQSQLNLKLLKAEAFQSGNVLLQYTKK